MTRCQLLALGILAPAAHAATVTYRNNPPYFPYLDLIESGHDEYPVDPPRKPRTNSARRLPVAESWYRKALAADPQWPEGNQGLGLTLAKLGRPTEAEPLFINATKLRPAFPTAWNNLSVLYLQAGDTSKAISALEAGIAASPGDELLYHNLGRAYIQVRHPDQARIVMQRLLKVQPNIQVAQQALKDLANVP